jgi:hypothetical protein
LEIIPSEAFTAVIPGNGKAEFRWTLVAHNNEEQRATLWCFTQGLSGMEMMLARDISLPVKTILEMKFSLSRWILGEVVLLCLILIAVTVYKVKKH